MKKKKKNLFVGVDGHRFAHKFCEIREELGEIGGDPSEKLKIYNNNNKETKEKDKRENVETDLEVT